MGILRKDYTLNRWVYYAVSRKDRPHEFKAIETKAQSKKCVFCPKNEDLTPPEIGRIEYKNSWKMRWFCNKFAAVDINSKTKFKTKGFFSESGTFGSHEIIVETPHHKSQLGQLPLEDIEELLYICKTRINELGKKKGIKYVQVFKNHGKEAGTSLIHSHTQVVAMHMVPTSIEDKIKASKKNGKCAYCKIVKIESKSKRKIFETKNVLAFAPFASRFNYEAWIFPKRHIRNLQELEPQEMHDFAAAIKLILSKLGSINASYNLMLNYSPEGEFLHLHFEITPRLSTWAGFEISTEAIINSVLPEDAARFYKGLN